MKIALLGSAPSSLSLAPTGDPSWHIWGCSPGVYPYAPRVNAWFELHRWEPGEIGKPHTQKQWFSPEYVAWMAKRDPQQCPVWMYEAVPEIPASRALPVKDLLGKYGTYFFTSSLAWMLACAIEDILEHRQNRKAAGLDLEEDAIGMWGVDMAANEEYGYQRAGCQHFLLLAADLGIRIQVPPESDLLRPMPLYAISESSHWMIKHTARRRELEGRLEGAKQTLKQAEFAVAHLTGALDDHNYHMQTWGEDRDGMGISPHIIAQQPAVRAIIQEQLAEQARITDQAADTAVEKFAAAANSTVEQILKKPVMIGRARSYPTSKVRMEPKKKGKK